MRKIIACLAAIAALSLGSVPAYADPAFGPGNGGGTGNSKCHPPGQTVDVPGCK